MTKENENADMGREGVRPIQLLDYGMSIEAWSRLKDVLDEKGIPFDPIDIDQVLEKWGIYR